jgi:hypothetical protein
VAEDSSSTIDNVVGKAVEVAEEAVDKPWVQRLAILGFYTKGFLFIVIGVFAVSLLFGLDGGRLADARSALAVVAREPYGKFFLIIFIIGAAGHGSWNIMRGLADVDRCGRKWPGMIRRVVAVLVGFFYLGLALSALELVLATDISEASSEAEETFIAILLAIPLGSIPIILIGLSVAGAGISECYAGLSGKFRENYRTWEIKGLHHAFINVLGAWSFTARAILLVMMGYFFVRAAVDGMPGGVGLDTALLILLRSGYGRLLLGFTAGGLIAHGVLAFYEAKYRRIS